MLKCCLTYNVYLTITMILASLTPGNWIALATILVTIIIAFLAFYGNMKTWQGKTDTSIENLAARVNRLDEKFDKYIMNSLATSKSPLKLTDEGLKIFNRPKIQEFVKAKLEEIIQRMKEVPHESAYRAQEALFNVLGYYKTGDSQVILENEAFETGQHIDILMKVIGIGIRDEVFTKLGISTDEIDKTDPNIKDPAK